MGNKLRRICLYLTLCSTAFVQITGVVGWQWLLPFFALTLAAPLFQAWIEKRSWKILWNAGVLALFVLLASDAKETGVRYLLEDGLILAAFCQVHLLNNLGRRQNPDLFFFNGFLIALVTAFFSPDSSYILLFLAYVPGLFLAFQLRAIEQAGLDPDSSRARPEAGRALRISAFALGLSFLGFGLLPRDFKREGWASKLLNSRNLGQEVGFSDRIELGQQGPTKLSNKPVLELRILQGKLAFPPRYWRGATLSLFHSGSWEKDPRTTHPGKNKLPPYWLQTSTLKWKRPAKEGERSLFEIKLKIPGMHQLFLPEQGVQIHSQGQAIQGRKDGTFIRPWIPLKEKGFSYYVTVGKPKSPGRVPSLLRSSLLIPPMDQLPANGRAFLDQVRATLQPGISSLRIARILAERISSLAPYLLPGEQGAARNLEDLFNGKGAHCEFFATALALCLREFHIPARVATGFLLREWDSHKRRGMIRQKDAHAWVEVPDAQRGWVVFDATPAASSPTVSDPEAEEFANKGLLSRLWTSLLGFDQKRQQALLSSPSFWLSLLGLALGLWGIFFLFKRKSRSLPREYREYQRLLKRLGLQRAPHETPAEVLLRSRLSPKKQARLEKGTRRLETSYYGGGS